MTKAQARRKYVLLDADRPRRTGLFVQVVYMLIALIVWAVFLASYAAYLAFGRFLAGQFGG